MNRWIAFLALFLAGAFQTAAGQIPGMGMGMGMGMGPGTAAMDERFLNAAPDIGERVPNVDVVDDRGNPVNIREVATGQYTVLVLGCLT